MTSFVGILNFDAVNGRWEWDEDRAVQSKISQNVVDLMASKIKLLPERTQNLLKLASCIGIFL
jgi:predicted ATPase